MANYYWNPVADSAWYDGVTATWATTYNGTPAIVNPLSTDNCFFTATNSHKCTIGATANCNNLYFDNADNGGNGDYVGQLAGGSALGIYGNLAMSGGAMTNSYGGNITFQQASGTATIKSNTITFGSNLFFNHTGTTFQLLDDLWIKANFSLTNGSFDPNGHTVNISTQGVTNSISGSSTFYNLTINDTGVSNGLSLGANITVTNNLTIAGTGAGNARHFILSNIVGTPRTITCTGASVNYSNVDFQDITIVNGTLGTNASVGDCGGNTGITFTGNVDQHWTDAGSGTNRNWSNANNWTSRVPLPQDNVFMNFGFGTSQTVTADMPRLGKSIDWTGATWTTALTWGNSVASVIYGSLTMINNLTFSSGQTFTFAGRGNYTWTPYNVSHTRSITISAPTGTLTLGGVLSMTGISFTLANGTFNTGNYNITGGYFQLGLGTKTLTLGSSTWEINNTTSGCWSASNNSSGFTNTPSSNSLIKITDTTNGAIAFAGGNFIYNNIYFNRGASTGNITITGSNTFNDFKDDGTAAHSILFTNGTTQTITTMEVSGTAGNLHTLSNSSGTTVANLTTASAQISNDYLNIAYLNVTPANVWYAGANSNNTGGADTNWIFTAPPVYSSVGISFLNASALNFNSCEFYIKKSGTPTGSAYAYLYAVTGSAGSYIPTGSALATSNALDVSTLTTSYQLITFSFASPYSMSAGTNYIIAFQYTGGDSSDYVVVGEGSTYNGGNGSYYLNSTWSVNPYQPCFYIYEVSPGNIASATIAGNNIASATITASNIANGTITATQIANATITATQIALLTITAGNIANATITGTQIASTTIAAGNIVSNTITATQIANNTITASQIANNTITASQIANATITTSQISGTAGITGAQIATATIAGSNIVNNTITATQIANTTITASQIANLTITASQIANLTIVSGKVNTALMSFTHNIAFSLDGSTPTTQVDWAAGTLTTSDGTSYSIVLGNTGVMSATTYVYLAPAVSTTVLQTTTTLGTATGDGKILVCIAKNNTGAAIFQVFGNVGLSGTAIASNSITASQIAANTITASQIAAATITASQIASSTITATQIAANTITASQLSTTLLYAGAITLDTNGLIKGGQSAYNTGTGFFLGYSNSAYQFSIGDGSSNYLTWDGTTMNYSGVSRITWKASTMFEAITRYPQFNSGKYQVAIDAGLYLRMADGTGTTQASSYIGFYMTMGPSAGILAFNSCSFSAEVHMRNAPSGAGQFFVGVTDAGFEAGSSMNFAGHKQYGFKVIEVAGTMTLYSTNANGSSETTTNIQTINQGEAHLLSASISGSSIKFYVDNVLAATHSTNLPSSSQTTQNIGYFALNNNGANNAYDWVISSYNFEKTAGFL